MADFAGRKLGLPSITFNPAVGARARALSRAVTVIVMVIVNAPSHVLARPTASACARACAITFTARARADGLHSYTLTLLHSPTLLGRSSLAADMGQGAPRAGASRDVGDGTHR